MITQVYLIKPFTNMHVGSGKENSGIVDNTIQRDILTHFPAINSTSLKGALREYAENCIKFTDDDIKYVFGKGNEKKDGKEQEKDKNHPGHFIFYSANLLSIPARSDKYPFLNAICPQIVRDFLRITALWGNVIGEKERHAFDELLSIQFDDKVRAICFEESVNDSVVEFYDVKAVLHTISEDSLAVLKNWTGNNPVWVNDDDFKNISEKLPVIARNHLDNGQSTNLWYEEIVPRETVFYTFISAPEGNWRIEFDKSVLQIGANASVGYGVSEIYKPEKTEEETR
jgi:CRISPR-associated protein Cmr4